MILAHIKLSQKKQIRLTPLTDKSAKGEVMQERIIQPWLAKWEKNWQLKTTNF